MQLLKKDNKDELAKLLQDTESVEIFWFPFNSIFNNLLKKVDKKVIFDRELSSGNLASDSNRWDPGMTIYGLGKLILLARR